MAVRSRLIPSLALVLVVGACHHAQSTGPTGQGEEGEHSGSPAKAHAPAPARPGGPPVATSPSSLLAPGAARRLQAALRSKGFYDREPTGTVDRTTTEAIRRFQRDQGLAETGWPDYETVRRLGLEPDSVYRENPAAKKDPNARG